jgi:hypothetical protein
MASDARGDDTDADPVAVSMAACPHRWPKSLRWFADHYPTIHCAARALGLDGSTLGKYLCGTGCPRRAPAFIPFLRAGWSVRHLPPLPRTRGPDCEHDRLSIQDAHVMVALAELGQSYEPRYANRFRQLRREWPTLEARIARHEHLVSEYRRRGLEEDDACLRAYADMGE